MQNAPRGLVGHGPVCYVFGGRDLPSSLAVAHSTPCEVHLFEAEPALRAMAWGAAPTLYVHPGPADSHPTAHNDAGFLGAAMSRLGHTRIDVLVLGPRAPVSSLVAEVIDQDLPVRAICLDLVEPLTSERSPHTTDRLAGSGFALMCDHRAPGRSLLTFIRASWSLGQSSRGAPPPSRGELGGAPRDD